MTNFEKLQKWLIHTPTGRYVLAQDKIFYHNCVQHVFGYYAVQIQFAQINFLNGNKISQHYVLGQDITCNLHFLPFETNSVDLIICPHILEFTDNYYRFLEECYRILIPNGKLIITSFSKSILNQIIKKPDALATANFIDLNTLEQQLSALNFRMGGGKFFCYRPLISNANWLAKLSFMDKALDRWLPTAANVFGLIAIKEIFTYTPIIYPQENYNTSSSFNPSFGTTKTYYS